MCKHLSLQVAAIYGNPLRPPQRLAPRRLRPCAHRHRLLPRLEGRPVRQDRRGGDRGAGRLGPGVVGDDAARGSLDRAGWGRAAHAAARPFRGVGDLGLPGLWGGALGPPRPKPLVSEYCDLDIIIKSYFSFAFIIVNV